MSLSRWFSYELPETVGGYTDDLYLAADAALRGGEAAMRHYGTGSLEVSDKGHNDPVTEADRAANRAILELLSVERPADVVLSEESPPPAADQRSRRLWVVDPLDGTKEFIARNGEFCVMVGLAEGGAAVLGAVYQPDPQLLYFGIVTGGAWIVDLADPKPTAVPLVATEGGAPPLRVVESRSHPDERLRQLERDLGEVRVVRSGSVGIKCALVARGLADLYVHPVPFLKEWDTCAPEAILRGAGGRVTDCAGETLAYGKPNPPQPGGIFAACADVWVSVAPIVRRVAAPLFADGSGR